ncbi:MAG: hypothetical protein IBJ11_05370 [Phycisphaerales bacterium]|nr:hypothetical protein [Phycisphaerales bacterium]
MSLPSLLASRSSNDFMRYLRNSARVTSPFLLTSMSTNHCGRGTGGADGAACWGVPAAGGGGGRGGGLAMGPEALEGVLIDGLEDLAAGHFASDDFACCVEVGDGGLAGLADAAGVGPGGGGSGAFFDKLVAAEGDALEGGVVGVELEVEGGGGVGGGFGGDEAREGQALDAGEPAAVDGPVELVLGLPGLVGGDGDAVAIADEGGGGAELAALAALLERQLVDDGPELGAAVAGEEVDRARVDLGAEHDGARLDDGDGAELALGGRPAVAGRGGAELAALPLAQLDALPADLLGLAAGELGPVEAVELGVAEGRGLDIGVGNLGEELLSGAHAQVALGVERDAVAELGAGADELVEGADFLEVGARGVELEDQQLAGLEGEGGEADHGHGGVVGVVEVGAVDGLARDHEGLVGGRAPRDTDGGARGGTHRVFVAGLVPVVDGLLPVDLDLALGAAGDHEVEPLTGGEGLALGVGGADVVDLDEPRAVGGHGLHAGDAGDVLRGKVGAGGEEQAHTQPRNRVRLFGELGVDGTGGDGGDAGRGFGRVMFGILRLPDRGGGGREDCGDNHPNGGNEGRERDCAHG